MSTTIRWHFLKLGLYSICFALSFEDIWVQRGRPCFCCFLLSWRRCFLRYPQVTDARSHEYACKVWGSSKPQSPKNYRYVKRHCCCNFSSTSHISIQLARNTDAHLYHLTRLHWQKLPQNVPCVTFAMTPDHSRSRMRSLALVKFITLFPC